MEKLIAGTGMTYLRVYDQYMGPDGINSGCAHVHGLTDEAYFGISGEGALELHDPDNGYRRIPITKGVYIQMPPWTLHRSVSTDGLEALVLMGNQGLAERGDARIFFSSEIDEDPDAYESSKNLVQEGEKGALRRRDLSANAYMALMHQWEVDKNAYRTTLERFFDHHKETIENTPALKNYRDKSDEQQADVVSAVGTWSTSNSKTALGMCGSLRQIQKLQEV